MISVRHLLSTVGLGCLVLAGCENASTQMPETVKTQASRSIAVVLTDQDKTPPALAVRPNTLPDGDSGDGGNQQLPDLAQQLTQLKSQVSTLTQQQQEHSLLITQLRDIISNEGESQLNSDPEARALQEAQVREQAERKSEEHFAFLNRGVDSEPLDQEWSTQAVDHIEQALAGKALNGTQLYDIDCRKTLCRVEIGHSDAEAFETFQMQFPMQVGTILPSVMMEHTDLGNGQIDSIVYLARQGYELSRSSLEP